ncbi:class I SAM-dependent methyltransferase [Luteimonas vadosa]|uniref:Tetratricopeptide repeat protein n=1 Tax=Luteimonas vadosa TaxID=1165507 RepID=A0ABP9E7X6_9GAMM
MDRARRDWLQGLRARHAADGSSASALELARGEWRCGDYADARTHFESAVALAPGSAEARVALLNALSMLGLFDRHAEVLADALQRMPREPMVQFHAARSEVPGDLAAARERLRPFDDIPLLAQYARALGAILAGTIPLEQNGDGDDYAMARQEALRWVLRHSSSPSIHTGHPARVLERALELAPAEGLTLECGVYFGRSLDIIARHVPDEVHGFDSFQGLPEAWTEHEGAGAYTTAGRLPAVPGHVRLHAGWFEETLPAFLQAHPGPIGLLHVDCDLYSSTRTVLELAAPRLQAGSIVVFDDLLAFPGYERHELRAFQEHCQATGMRWEIVAACLLGREVAFRVLPG